jgi:hypothetical protein
VGVFLHRCLIAACALYLSGAHWAALQVTAWTGMLVTRAPQTGVVAALETTFDGEHPCGLCAAVQEGQKQEHEQQPLPPGLGKLKEMKLVAMTICAAPAGMLVGAMEWREAASIAAARMEAPPTPPPLA